MVYTIDERQLLDLWAVVRYLGYVREISDAAARSEILTKAQILLTAFVLGLQPFPKDQVNTVISSVSSA
jgi:hypothetical protein